MISVLQTRIASHCVIVVKSFNLKEKVETVKNSASIQHRFFIIGTFLNILFIIIFMNHFCKLTCPHLFKLFPLHFANVCSVRGYEVKG